MTDPNKNIDAARKVLYHMRMFPTEPDSIERDRRLKVSFEQWNHAVRDAVRDADKGDDQMTNHTTTAIGYVRVAASDSESGAHAERQRVTIHAYCEQHGISLSGIVFESGAPGDGLERVLEALKAGSADVLIVHRLDRLARNVSTLIELTEASETQGWQLVIIDTAGSNLEINMNSPTSRMLITILAAIDRYEREIEAYQASTDDD